MDIIALGFDKALKKKDVCLPFSDRPTILENLGRFVFVFVLCLFGFCFVLFCFVFLILKFAFLNKITEMKLSKFIATAPKVYSVGTGGIIMCLLHIISTRLFDVTYLDTENHDLYCISNCFFNIQI